MVRLVRPRRDLRIQGLDRCRDDRREVRHRLDLNFRRHVRDLYDLKRQLLRPCSLPLPCFDSVEAVTRQESRSLQRGEPPFGVFARNPEDGGDFVGGRQVLVVVQVLQDVRRAPLRKPGREPVDDLFERFRSERRAFHFHVSFTITDDEGVEVRMLPQHLLTIPLERLLHRVRRNVLSKSVFVEANLRAQFHEGIIRGGETFEPEGFHHPTEEFRRLVPGLQLRRRERLACGERALDLASEVVIGLHRHVRQRDGFENPVDRAPLVDSVFLHPSLQGFELATHFVRDLYVVTVDLSQTLKDRLQPPGPPAPRIREVDDLDRRALTLRCRRFHRSATWYQESRTTNHTAGGLAWVATVPPGAGPLGDKRR